jgi:hypothetical protein
MTRKRLVLVIAAVAMLCAPVLSASPAQACVFGVDGLKAQDKAAPDGAH